MLNFFTFCEIAGYSEEKTKQRLMLPLRIKKLVLIRFSVYANIFITEHI